MSSPAAAPRIAAPRMVPLRRVTTLTSPCGVRSACARSFSWNEARRIVMSSPNRARAAAFASYIIGNSQGGETVEIRRFKSPGECAGDIQPTADAVAPFGISQGILDRRPHIRRGKLGKHRAVHKLHHRMHDRFGMNNDLNLVRRQIKKPAGFDQLQRFVEHRGSGEAVRNGPPLAVRMTRRTSCNRPDCIA